ncbi:flagellar assembly protein FliH [Agaribacterium sp. ZY112]|uniref:flagellar assembly protein FliH n=1 Tax=Agaribacterium sp. ZY112 TaxID=3233574 RepID=UPI0035249930
MSDNPSNKSGSSKERIPYEDLEGSSVKGWALPSMQGRAIKPKKKNTIKKDKVKIENVPASESVQPLTAEQLQDISEQARKEGFQQGLKEGTEQGLLKGQKTGERTGHQQAYKQAEKEIQALQSQLENCAQRLFEPMQNREALLENVIVDMALKLASRLVADEIAASPERLLAIVHKVMASVPKSAKEIHLRLNSKDAECIRSLVPESKQWQLEIDDNLSSGGLIVNTESSHINFSVEQRLQEYLDKSSQLTNHEHALNDVPDYHVESDLVQREIQNLNSETNTGNQQEADALVSEALEVELLSDKTIETVTETPPSNQDDSLTEQVDPKVKSDKIGDKNA